MAITGALTEFNIHEQPVGEAMVLLRAIFCFNGAFTGLVILGIQLTHQEHEPERRRLSRRKRSLVIVILMGLATTIWLLPVGDLMFFFLLTLIALLVVIVAYCGRRLQPREHFADPATSSQPALALPLVTRISVATADSNVLSMRQARASINI